MGPLEILILLAVIATPIMLITRYVQRRNSQRPCPRCGNQVPNGLLRCQACGLDFGSVGSPPPPPPPPPAAGQ